MALLFAMLLLGSVWETHGLPKVTLTIQPEEALVERGGTIQLNCSMDCPGGKVQWEGLDTDLGNTASYGASSVLTLTNTAIRMKGMKICTGQCRGQPKEKRVNLQVYSFPDTLRLDSWPETLMAGQAATLSCSLSHVYPPGALKLSWWKGDEQLVPPEEVEEEEMAAVKEQLFSYRSVLRVPRVPENVTYGCSAVLRLKRRVFHQHRNMTVSGQATPELPGTTDGASSAFQTETTSHGTVPGLSSDSTSPSLFLTENPTPVSFTVGKTSAFPLRSLAVSTRHTEVTTHPASLPLSPKGPPSSGAPTLLQMTKPLPKTTVISTPSKDVCRPVISPVPPQGNIGGPLTITCLATNCGKDVQLWWVETPVHLSQYHKEEDKGRSTLTINSLGEEHQGIYRCAAEDGQSRMASLRIEVSDQKIRTGSIVALGTTGSLLGLVITAYVSHRLRRQ